MDQSEKSPQQQYSAGDAGQLANIPPFFYGTPNVVATCSNNNSVPASSMMQPPLPPVSTSQHQLANQDAQAQHSVHVRERLRLFWANQMQEMKPADLKKHSFPLNPIKRIMKSDNDVKMIAKESTALLAKACEMLVLNMTSQAWINTEEDGRRTVQNKDLAWVIDKTDIYDFLVDVIPRDVMMEARQHVGSSTESTMPGYNVLQQQGVGLSSGTSLGGLQPPPFMPFSQSLRKQQQPSMTWPRAQQQMDQNTSYQPPMPRLQAQQNAEQPSPSLPQLVKHTQDQQKQQNEKRRKRGGQRQ